MSRLDVDFNDGYMTETLDEIQVGTTTGPGPTRVVVVLDATAAQDLGHVIAAGSVQLHQVGLPLEAWNHLTVDVLASAAQCSRAGHVDAQDRTHHRGAPPALSMTPRVDQ